MRPRDTVHKRHLQLQRKWEIWRAEVWDEFLRAPKIKDLARTIVLTMLFASVVLNVAQYATIDAQSAKLDEIHEAAEMDGGVVRIQFAD